jgi:hypothetical protein
MSSTGKRYTKEFKDLIKAEHKGGASLLELSTKHHLSKSTLSLWTRNDTSKSLTTHINTKKQGDAGVGVAIGWFASQGWTVSVPLTDSQEYDLITDSEQLLRVQVKTTSFKTAYGVFSVSLTVKGGNRTSVGKIKLFDPSKVDALFILTSDKSMYFIPSSVIKTNSVNLGSKYQRYKVSF